MSGEQPVLIAAYSARALAEAARRSGYAPYVADLFGDADTVGASAAYRKVAGDLDRGFDRALLLNALEKLSEIAPRTSAPLRFVYGGGFEATPDLLEAIAGRWRVIGNQPEIVRRVKNPFILREVCRDLGVSHPETRRERPRCVHGWLEKTIGGAGGAHVRRADAVSTRIAGYFQEEVSGRAVSAFFIADGESSAEIIGFSQQWTAAAPGQPFRYGGAAQPALLGDTLRARMTVAIEKIAAYFGLRGLNSADFMVDGDTSWLLEVNPRPGATLDIYDTEYNRLFARHCDASEGLATTSVYFDDGGTSAAAVVYADNGDLTTPYISESPDWLKDRPLPGTQIRAGHPLCTVLANKKTISQCRQVCDERGLLAQALYYNQK